MKNLTQFINELYDGPVIINAIYNTTDDTTVADVYENLLNQIIVDGQINEGLFSRIGDKLKAWGEKASMKGEEIDKKIDQMSSDAKAAINNAKKKAGEKWDDIKGVYTNTISAIDNAITASKDTIASMAEKFKIKKASIEALIANVCANALASGSEIGKKIGEWTKDSAKYATQIAACAAIITSAKIATAAGYNSSMIIDLLDAAGVK